MKIYDISMVIDENIITYPGDMKVKVHHLKTAEAEDWNLTGITLGSHTGTHVDSPSHIQSGRMTINEIDLHQCYGAAMVLDLEHISMGHGITKMDLIEKLPKEGSLENMIVLLKTQNSKYGYTQFRDDWVWLSEQGATFLNTQHIKAVGIDALTIGPLQTHHTLLLNNILVYEGLNLTEISPGTYTFIGFPLKIKTEGSPIRAVLLEN